MGADVVTRCCAANRRPNGLSVPGSGAAGSSAAGSSPLVDSVNMVNAPVLARDRSIDVAEVIHDRPGDYQTLIKLTVETERFTRSVAGTLFGGNRPRVVEIKGIAIEAELTSHMLYVSNADKPGLIGASPATDAIYYPRSSDRSERHPAKVEVAGASPAADASFWWP